VKRKAELEELAQSNEEQLVAMYDEKAKELFNLRNEKSLNKKLDRPHRLKATRRSIARILTCMKQRQREV
jgi:ribosomal protein L29